MQKSTKRLAVARSVYPLDYNRNNPMAGGAFDRWRANIREELVKCSGSHVTSGVITVYIMTPEQLDSILKMESLRLQAINEFERRRP